MVEIQRSLFAGTGIEKQRYSSRSNGGVNGFGMDRTRSGCPRTQSPFAGGAGGRSSGRPSGAPASTHCASVLMSRCDNRRTPTKSPAPSAGFQGGIFRSCVMILICGAIATASLYEISGNGAMSPGRWQLWQLSWRMRTTSLLKVGGPGAVTERLRAAANVKTTTAARTRVVLRMLVSVQNCHEMPNEGMTPTTGSSIGRVEIVPSRCCSTKNPFTLLTLEKFSALKISRKNVSAPRDV